MSIGSQVDAKKDSVSSVVPTILVAEVDKRSTVTSQGAIVEGDDAVLARLGYKQEFHRAFNPIEVFGLGFSIIGLFPSIASVLVFAIPNGGPVAMFWGWAICSFFLMFVALALAELGSSAPTAGGLYYWMWTFATPRWRNVLAWVVGYSNSIGFIAGLASVDWGCAVQLMAVVSIGNDTTFVPTTGQTYGVYVALLICHALVSSLATSVVARLQGIYIALNILLCFAIIIALPAATPSELKNTASFAFGGFSNFNGWPNGFAFVLSFLAPLWTIGGFDAPVHISEEAANARVAVPWGIISAVGIAGILGWAINVAVAFCMGTDLEAIMNSPIGQPMATILFNSFGKKGTLAVWSVVVFVQYGKKFLSSQHESDEYDSLCRFLMGSSTLTAASRQTFAFARDRGLPLSRYLYHVNSYTHTPINAMWFSAFIALLLGLLAFAGPNANSAIFGLGVTGQYTAFIIPIACRFAGGKKWSPGPFTLGRWGLPVALVAISWMTFSIIILAFPTSPMPGAPEMNYMIVVLGGWIVLCLAYYYFPVYGGACWFNGPLANIGQDGKVIAVDDREKVFKDTQ
ncbi:putative amino-acid permease C11D3.08c [Grifola frondosa]|uniref:Putative amino-acid permease C11D3.08c n=1 Tax=Grifola frondosa TaxID=5627 RepID=A0A1C7MU43_GRIFR|nr:putative amino-acid permease C11D3.08c [Grifola frondosa]